MNENAVGLLIAYLKLREYRNAITGRDVYLSE